VAIQTGQSGKEFPSTHWSQVVRAADIDPLVRRKALEQLLLRYLPAFRAHLLRRWHLKADVAEDLLQGFVCNQVVAEDLMAHGDRSRGRFRTYLLTALNRYILKARRHDSARKRAPEQPVLGLEDEAMLRADASAADVFELEWARQVISQALGAMREHCQSSERPHVWELFHCRVVAPLLEQATPPPYEQLVRRLGIESAMQATNLLATGKRMFARILRSTIGQYAADGQGVEAEMRDLWNILSRSKSPEAVDFQSPGAQDRPKSRQ
jgi:hypothetical protein